MEGKDDSALLIHHALILLARRLQGKYYVPVAFFCLIAIPDELTTVDADSQ